MSPDGLRRSERTCALVSSLMLLVGCGLPASSGPSQASQLGAPQPSPRVLTMAVRHEPIDFSPKIPQAANAGSIKPLFNAGLGLLDDVETTHPQLAGALPQLSTPTWLVFPNGQMETTYRLRTGLTWHDGRPLTSEDFVFAWHVYAHPGLGIFSQKPQDLIDHIRAPDASTIVIRWRAIYPDAGILAQEQLPPLPRHILEEPFGGLGVDPAKRELFLNHPYWTAGFVGAGPYRLVQWEPGTSVEGAAFDGYALGRPGIDRLVVRFIPDENTVLTSMLAGQVQLCYQYCLRFEHAMLLKREWDPARAGVVLLNPEAGTYAIVQFRPDFQRTPALLDPRVRWALAHGIDKQALLDGLFEGQGFIADSLVPPDKPHYPEVDRTASKYPFDPRRSEEMLNGAGLAKDRDGLFADGTGERFRPDFTALGGATSERAQAIMADTWRRAGIDTRPSVLPSVQVRDAQARHTFSGISWAGGGSEQSFTSDQIGTPATRWGGSNRGGWSNAEYDRLWDTYNGTLEAAERQRQLVRMAQIVSDDLPIFVLYFNFTTVAHAAFVQGPRPRTLWNVHDWVIS